MLFAYVAAGTEPAPCRRSSAGGCAAARRAWCATGDCSQGSFYWHFRNRQALVEAALRLWEEEHTEAVIAGMESEPDPAQRLRRLFTFVVGISPHDRIEVVLLAAAEDPLVAPVMRRATERRVGYVASLYEQLGLEAAEARRRALLAVSVYLGHVQLAHAAPNTLPLEPELWQLHVDRMLDLILP